MVSWHGAAVPHLDRNYHAAGHGLKWVGLSQNSTNYRPQPHCQATTSIIVDAAMAAGADQFAQPYGDDIEYAFIGYYGTIAHAGG